MVSVYICVKMNNSRDLFTDQYIPTIRLEVISKLRAYSLTLINMVVINGKNFKHVHSGISEKERYPD